MYCLTLDLAPGYQLMSLDGATGYQIMFCKLYYNVLTEVTSQVYIIHYHIHYSRLQSDSFMVSLNVYLSGEPPGVRVGVGLAGEGVRCAVKRIMKSV